MSEADQLRRQATRLFAQALKAREDGKPDYSDELITQASELFDRANEMDLRSSVSSLPAVAEAPQQPAQQQQQPQPKTERD